MPKIMTGHVMHTRLIPRHNSFKYGVYYLSIPLSQLQNLPISHNKFGLLSFYDKDHGHRDGSTLDAWVQSILDDYGLDDYNDITLVTMPRVMGYVFNPVSFWICRDKNHNIRAVICEVHNTFGERHAYVCAHENHRIIINSDILIGQKKFHVSPFLRREGHYEFRFDITDSYMDVSINFYNAEGEKQLITALKGQMNKLDKLSLWRAFWGYPLVTIKATFLIHWQALKIISKKIKYISKPKQNKEKVSGTSNLKKM